MTSSFSHVESSRLRALLHGSASYFHSRKMLLAHVTLCLSLSHVVFALGLPWFYIYFTFISHMQELFSFLSLSCVFSFDCLLHISFLFIAEELFLFYSIFTIYDYNVFQFDSHTFTFRFLNFISPILHMSYSPFSELSGYHILPHDYRVYIVFQISVLHIDTSSV